MVQVDVDAGKCCMKEGLLCGVVEEGYFVDVSI
jgi:hypothetical protein